MNLALFGIYPYLAGSVFLVGSLLRYEREQDGWGAYSSQLFGSRTYMLWASNLWHIGILLVFLGHFFGMVTPVFEWLRVPPLAHQWIAFAAGTTFGSLAMLGGNAGDMETFQAYLQSLVLLHPDPGLLSAVPLIYRIHMLCGMTVFLLFPFTRLVHIWTVPFNYLTRRYQLVRARRTA